MVHVGMSVANLGRSIEFYRLLLGAQTVLDTPFSGRQYESILALNDVMGRVALLRASGIELELFEFQQPRPRPADRERPVCELGITHFCIEVTDIEAEYRRLTAAGVSFHCAPLEFGKAKATYGRDPDGNVFELVERHADSQRAD
jgi:catechol 2,3-dioxygenase-like lactoylglutathione lyase family enzyme